MNPICVTWVGFAKTSITNGEIHLAARRRPSAREKSGPNLSNTQNSGGGAAFGVILEHSCAASGIRHTAVDVKMKMAAISDTNPWREVGGDAAKSETLSFEDDFKPFEKLPDSETYLSSLESKLKKLKGTNQETQRSDIIDGMEMVRCQHARDILLDEGYVGTFETVDDSSDKIVLPAYLVRRLCPEKQALCNEELQNLVLADELTKTTAEFRAAAAAAAAMSSSSDSEEREGE